MTAPKQPADHKPKAGAARYAIEWEGQTYTLDQDALDDADTIDLLTEGTEDQRALALAAKRIVGDEQWKRFNDSTREKYNGRMPFTVRLKFCEAVLEPLGNFLSSLNS